MDGTSVSASPSQGPTLGLPDKADRLCPGRPAEAEDLPVGTTFGAPRPEGTSMATTTERPAPDDPVRRILRAPVASIPAERSAREVAEELVADEVGAVLVDGSHGPVGIVSERDVVTALATGSDLDRLQAADLMSTELVWADPDDGIGDVARRMHEANVRHMPVRGASGAVAGIVSVRDVLDVLAAPTD
ncbi:hypothetical protein PSD17_19540 [Pseudonocardia sp. D17]|jgi:CBS domain-containing protein|nr:hypothetical protein PSD17_19540 [Pseudonocardia sp. D17]